MGKTKFKYGAVSSVWELEADNKLTAYAAMCCHFDRNSHLIALYEPKEVVEGDSWLNPFGKIAKRLDEIFGGEGLLTDILKNIVRKSSRHSNL